MGGNKSHNGPIMALGGINRHDDLIKLMTCTFFLYYYFLFALFFILDIHIVFLAPVEELFTKKNIG